MCPLLKSTLLALKGGRGWGGRPPLSFYRVTHNPPQHGVLEKVELTEFSHVIVPSFIQFEASYFPYHKRKGGIQVQCVA